MENLNVSHDFFSSFRKRKEFYDEKDINCAQDILNHLLRIETSSERPGMLLGKIQSGKTKTFLAAIALAFDNGFDISIILTKGTKALAKQTLRRVQREFKEFIEQDKIQTYDVMTLPGGMTGYELDQKLIIVAKKQPDNLKRLLNFFSEKYPSQKTKRVLIIDDEADYASLGFRRTKKQGVIINTTTRQIDDLRHILPNSSFLQVTATPYSLYLQPDDFILNGIEFRPVRPAFTSLVPVSPAYIGSKYYFERSQEENSIASFIFRPVTLQELDVLRHQDKRKFRLEECLKADAINTLRRAICNFIVGGSIRQIQEQDGPKIRKYSFLFHTESHRVAHAWQELIVSTIFEKLSDCVKSDPETLRHLLGEAYDDLYNSINIENVHSRIPSKEEVIVRALLALNDEWVMITKVNSEAQVEELLDDDGQLKLRTPFNFFIGGQILDRGITISNLIGFFYGRRPRIYQQDTVLQHSRMFGYRSLEDLSVTRFYTEPTIYNAMRRMHESDSALRSSIETDPDQPIIFIQTDARGEIRPCNPNKILISNTTTLQPFKRILPIGFQTEAKTRLEPLVREIDQKLDIDLTSKELPEPKIIPFSLALDLLQKVERSLIIEEELGYEFDWKACYSAISYLSKDVPQENNKGNVWCLVRVNRDLSRFQPALGPPFFSDAPDTAQREGAIARRVAIDIPMLIMIRQNGSLERGWLGSPFYWPVVMAQRNVPISIFAHETTQ